MAALVWVFVDLGHCIVLTRYPQMEETVPLAKANRSPSVQVGYPPRAPSLSQNLDMNHYLHTDSFVTTIPEWLAPRPS